jgi:hypothetical protein
MCYLETRPVEFYISLSPHKLAFLLQPEFFMSTVLLSETCLSCGQTDDGMPLVALRYAGGQTWICPQCLPILIHHQDQLTEKLGRSKGTSTPPHKKG